MGGALTKSNKNFNHNEIDHPMVRHLEHPFHFQMEPLWKKKYSKISSSMDNLKEFGMKPYGLRRTSSVSTVSKQSEGSRKNNTISLCDLRDLHLIDNPALSSRDNNTIPEWLVNADLIKTETVGENVNNENIFAVQQDINMLVDNLKALKKRVKRYNGTENPQELIDELKMCSENLNQIQSENTMFIQIRNKMKKRIKNYLEILALKVDLNKEERMLRRKSGPKEPSPFEYQLGKLREVEVKLDQISQGLNYYYRSVDQDEYVNIKNALGDCALILRDINTKGNISLITEKEICEDRLFDYQKQLEFVKENAGRRLSYMHTVEEEEEETEEEIEFIDDKSSYYSRANSVDTDEEFFDCYEDINLTSPSTPLGMYEQESPDDFNEIFQGKNRVEMPKIIVTEVQNVNVKGIKNLDVNRDMDKGTVTNLEADFVEESKTDITLLGVKSGEVKVDNIVEADKDDRNVTDLIRRFENKTEDVNVEEKETEEDIKIEEGVINEKKMEEVVEEEVVEEKKAEEDFKVEEEVVEEKKMEEDFKVEEKKTEEISCVENNKKIEEYQDFASQIEYASREELKALNQNKVEMKRDLSKSKDEKLENKFDEEENIYDYINEEENIYDEIGRYEEFEDEYQYIGNFEGKNVNLNPIQSKILEEKDDRTEARNQLLKGYGLQSNSYDKYSKVKVDKSKQNEIEENIYECPNDFQSDFIGLESAYLNNENYNELVSQRKQKEGLNEKNKIEKKKILKEDLKQRKYDSVINLSPIKEVCDNEELPPELKPKAIVKAPIITAGNFKISYKDPVVKKENVANLQTPELEHLEAKSDVNIQSKTLFEIYKDHLIPSVLRNAKEDDKSLEESKIKLSETRSSLDTNSTVILVSKGEKSEFNKYPDIIRPIPKPRVSIDTTIYENILAVNENKENLKEEEINEDSQFEMPIYLNVNEVSEKVNVDEDIRNEKRSNLENLRKKKWEIDESFDYKPIYANFDVPKIEAKQERKRDENFSDEKLSETVKSDEKNLETIYENIFNKEEKFYSNIVSSEVKQPTNLISVEEDLSLEAKDVLTELPSEKNKTSLQKLSLNIEKEENKSSEDIVFVPLTPTIPGRDLSDEEETDEVPNETRTALKSVMECVENMKECVNEFEGSKTDSEYISIFENLMKSMTILNGFRADDFDTIEYKQSILMEIIQCMKDLEDKVA